MDGSLLQGNIEYPETVQTTIDYSHDYSDVESLVVEMFRADAIQLNNTINIILIVGIVVLVGWIVTLNILKKVLKQQEKLKKEVESLKDSLKLSQRMLKVKNGIILEDEENV